MTFTVEQRNLILSSYSPAATQEVRDNQVKALAKQLNVSVPAVRGVLVYEKVYVTKVRSKKESEHTFNKEEIVNFLRVMINARDSELKSLSKATRKDLEVLANGFNELLEEAREAQKENK